MENAETSETTFTPDTEVPTPDTETTAIDEIEAIAAQMQSSNGSPLFAIAHAIMEVKLAEGLTADQLAPVAATYAAFGYADVWALAAAAADLGDNTSLDDELERIISDMASEEYSRSDDGALSENDEDFGEEGDTVPAPSPFDEV